MTVDYYRTILVKRWKCALICFLGIGLGAFLVSEFMTPVYQATALIRVVAHPTGNSAQNISLAQLLRTEAQLAISEPVLREVTSHYQNITPEQLAHRTLTAPLPGTQLFTITVEDARPQLAAALANDIANTLLKQQGNLAAQDNRQAQDQLERDLASTQRHINATNAQIAALQARDSRSPQLVTLQTQLKALQQHYSQLQDALTRLQVAQVQQQNFLQIVQPAQPVRDIVRPNVLLNSAIGLAAGLVLGILLAVIFEQLDTRVQTPEALTQLLQWSVLATVWKVRGVQRTNMVNPSGQEANIEAYRILRANIGFSGIDRALRTLVVTSATPGEGRSVIAANLAIFMAKAGKNTLLIDADLRHPVLHELFSIDPDKMGLSNAVLAASAPTSTTIRSQFLTPISQGQTGASPHFSVEPFAHDVSIPNLRVMPSGPLPPNPSEFLDSRAMQRFFLALEQCDAEIIIFDTPPVHGLSDAPILASKVDGTLIVVDTNRSSKSALKEMKVALTQADAHVLGCVLNKQRPGRHDLSCSYYEREAEPALPERRSGTKKPIAATAATRLQTLNATRSTLRLTLATGKKNGHWNIGR
jgi:Mrp family chromosome partitioning ATPase/capsular polysaccharide biosynthesis protein